MSIFASLPAPDMDDKVKPIIYQGSHVLPSKKDERGGWVDLAFIPYHVRRYRDNPDYEGPEDGKPEPFLRFGVNRGTVILDRKGVELVHDSLAYWLSVTK